MPRERAALAWTEVLTKLPEQGVPDELYERVRTQLSEKEVSDLSFAVASINAWNRVNIAAKFVPGSFDKPFGLDKANLADAAGLPYGVVVAGVVLVALGCFALIERWENRP